jgi:hypothetical protein
MNRNDEMRAAGELAGEAIGGVVEIVEDMHCAISERVDAALPPVARQVTGPQQVAVEAIYLAVDVGQRLLAVGVANLLARRNGPAAPPPSQTPLGARLSAIVNGLWGDRVERNHAILATRTAVRVDGHDVLIAPDTVAAAFPDAGSRLVVFVHGLVQDEAAWSQREYKFPVDGRPYGERLRDDLGLTPVYVRYNSGLRVSTNGQSLSALLDQLVAAWPVPVEEISIVGASMGGLVARSACHYGDRDGLAWAGTVRKVVTLGTPHVGAPLEQGAHVIDIVLRVFPETEPLSRILGSRSVGVKDLRYGNLVEEDWLGHDPDELLTDRATHVPFLDHATYYFVAATVTTDAAHPAGRLLGDGLVRYASASGEHKTRRLPFEHDNGFHLTGFHHLSMLNNSAVYDKLRLWLAPKEVAV